MAATAPKTNAATVPTAKPYRLRMLMRLMFFCQSEAERIEISEACRGRTDPSKWTEDAKAQHKNFKDLAQLCDYVDLIEPAFIKELRKVVPMPAKKKPAIAAAPDPEEEVTERVD